jgi:hypothetical protein
VADAMRMKPQHPGWTHLFAASVCWQPSKRAFKPVLSHETANEQARKSKLLITVPFKTTAHCVFNFSEYEAVSAAPALLRRSNTWLTMLWSSIVNRVMSEIILAYDPHLEAIFSVRLSRDSEKVGVDPSIGIAWKRIFCENCTRRWKSSCRFMISHDNRWMWHCVSSTFGFTFGVSLSVTFNADFVTLTRTVPIVFLKLF